MKFITLTCATDQDDIHLKADSITAVFVQEGVTIIEGGDYRFRVIESPSTVIQAIENARL